MSRNTIIITVYGRADGIDVRMPAKWIICQACDGHATTTRHIEPDGGGFTASEWVDACDDDPGFDGEDGFREKYLGGFYDRPCPTCEGKGRVQVIDREAVTGWRHRILLQEHDRQIVDLREIDAIEAMERRMGA